MPRVGVHMIVKDEAHVIERCLSSLRPLVDWWVVCDTGSTDGTQELVREVMAGVPGRLVERPWVSFGVNRQEALQAARELPDSRTEDYVLWIDADDLLTDLPATLPELTHDGYHLPVDYDGVRFHRVHLVRLGAAWRWVGAVHEHLDLSGADLATVDRPRVVIGGGGSRSADPERFHKDAETLLEALRQSPGDPRHQFYLAQSWRDAGELELALDAYRVRAANEAGWDQERWYALLQVARIRQRLGHERDEVASAFLDAYQAAPGRAESLVDLAQVEREHGRFEVAVLYARAASLLPEPGAGALFVEPDAYGWRRWDELAVSCYWSGLYAEGSRAAEQALALRPADPRLAANLEWFRDKE